MADRCPHKIRKQAGDESLDFCELTERLSGRIQHCLLESGEECETWNEIQIELKTGEEESNKKCKRELKR